MTVTSNDAAARSAIALSDRRASIPALLRGSLTKRVPLLRKPISVGLMAELAADLHGRVPIYLDQPFAWDPQARVELDFVEYAELVRQFSAVLKQAGVRPWDRVVVLKTPNYDIQALAWAAARIGAVPALLSAKLDPDIINILLERLQAKYIITDPEVARHARLDAARLKALSLTAIAGIEGGIPVADLWGGPVPAPSPLKIDEPMMITHTSSTTGVSKMAECSAQGVSHTAWVESFAPFVHNHDELFASAISHVHVRAATTQQAAFARGTPLLGIGNPDDETVVRMYSRYRPTIAEAHPNAFVAWEQLADHPARPFASVRVFFNTFDAIHPRTVRRLLQASERAYPIWLQSYGMTETQVVTVGIQTKRMALREGERRSRAVGWPVPGVRVRYVNPETQKPQQPGMIQVKTVARSLSFVGTPEKFAARRHGKWFDTGDWGRRGPAGQVEVLDRVADRIEGVESCLWIEDVLLERIPDAEEIVVVPDEGGRPVPVVCMRSGTSLSAETWQAASRGLTGLGEPFEVKADDLQRTATKKPRRYLLSEMVKNRDHDGSGSLKSEVVLRDGA